jgi:putative tryptophan/tyrosine transport system substrate-binding protein
MRRREFIALLGGAAAAWPRAAQAQQPTIPVIGWLTIRSLPLDQREIAEVSQAAFRDGLSERGYIVGTNVSIDFRFADGRPDRYRGLAEELVARRVNMIVASDTASALAAKAATSTIPIIFTLGVDPVAAGLVASFNQPGGNLTGYTSVHSDLGAKRLELVREVVPSAAVIGLLVNPNNHAYTETETKELSDAARSLGVQLHIVTASSESDLVPAFETLVRHRVDALVMSADPFLNSRYQQIVALAARHRAPAIYAYRFCVTVSGGLMSYGTSQVDNWRTVGAYSGRIRKGQKPADLPVIQPTKFELAINLKTAKTLGLELPPSLLARADEVIE